jgi:hypothetical protein
MSVRELGRHHVSELEKYFNSVYIRVFNFVKPLDAREYSVDSFVTLRLSNFNPLNLKNHLQ